MPDDVLTVEVLYSCDECGLKKIAVPVPARMGDEPNVVVWMETICVPLLAQDHRRRSPECHPPTLKEIMIPVTGADRVGGIQKH